MDSHCHLYELGDDSEIEAVLERARRAEVSDVVVLGVDADTSRRAARLARREGVWAGVGHHPTGAKDWRAELLDDIVPLLEDPNVVAVGESGIDLYWDTSFLDDQVAALKAHIELAKTHDRALVLHTRASATETIEVLEEQGAPERLVFHCWSGDREQLRRALALDAYVSFAGNVTYKSAGDLRAAAAEVPPDRLLLETDSPYLAPVPHRGERNEPAFVADVGSALADALGLDPAALAERTSANARSLFGLV